MSQIVCDAIFYNIFNDLPKLHLLVCQARYNSSWTQNPQTWHCCKDDNFHLNFGGYYAAAQLTTLHVSLLRAAASPATE